MAPLLRRESGQKAGTGAVFWRIIEGDGVCAENGKGTSGSLRGLHKYMLIPIIYTYLIYIYYIIYYIII